MNKKSKENKKKHAMVVTDCYWRQGIHFGECSDNITWKKQGRGVRTIWIILWMFSSWLSISMNVRICERFTFSRYLKLQCIRHNWETTRDDTSQRDEPNDPQNKTQHNKHTHTRTRERQSHRMRKWARTRFPKRLPRSSLGNIQAPVLTRN